MMKVPVFLFNFILVHYSSLVLHCLSNIYLSRDIGNIQKIVKNKTKMIDRNSQYWKFNMLPLNIFFSDLYW